MPRQRKRKRKTKGKEKKTFTKSYIDLGTGKILTTEKKSEYFIKDIYNLPYFVKDNYMYKTPKIGGDSEGER